MADFDKFYRTLTSFEGGYQDMPEDSGNWLDGKLIGTNHGITPAVYKEYFGYTPTIVQMKTLAKDKARDISKKLYWDKIKGDLIHSQSVAELLFDFAFNSGQVTAVKKLQEVIGVVSDGIIGPRTLTMLNILNPLDVFEELKDKRKAFVQEIVRRKPTQKKFITSWLKRISSFKFKS